MLNIQMCVDPPGITEFTLPACCCDLAPAVAMDRKAVDGTDRQTDGRTDTRPLHRPYAAYYAGSVNKPCRTGRCDGKTKQTTMPDFCRCAVV